MLRSWLALLLVLVSAVVVQSTLLAQVRPLGVSANVVLASVAAVGLTGGAVRGATYGFFAGLVIDLLLTLPAGVSALVYALVGFALGWAVERLGAPALWAALLAVGVASVVGVAAYAVIERALGSVTFSWLFLLRTAGLVGCYNLVLAIVIVPIVRGVMARVPRPGI